VTANICWQQAELIRFCKFMSKGASATEVPKKYFVAFTLIS
jgi:hypothetical protein